MAMSISCRGPMDRRSKRRDDYLDQTLKIRLNPGIGFGPCMVSRSTRLPELHYGRLALLLL